MLDQERADRVFVETYLRHEGRDDAAAVIAYKKSGALDIAWPTPIAAERMLDRLRPQIDEARGQFKVQSGERSRETILADLDAVYRSALNDKDHGAAVNAKRLEAQLQGFLQENVTVTHKVDLSSMTDEQLMQVVARAKTIDGVSRRIEAHTIEPKGIGHLKQENVS